MAERKWSSPRMFLSLYGDKEKARRLERKARVLVGYLFDQLRPGQTYRTNNWRLKDGSMIKATVWRDVLGERAQVKIFSPPTKPGSWSELLAFMESGLVKIIDGSEEAYLAALFYSEDNLVYYASHNPKWLDWIGVSSEADSVSSIYRIYEEAMPPLTWTRKKSNIYPNPAYLFGANSGKALMLAQAQVGTVCNTEEGYPYDKLGSYPIDKYIADGGSVARVTTSGTGGAAL